MTQFASGSIPRTGARIVLTSQIITEGSPEGLPIGRLLVSHSSNTWTFQLTNDAGGRFDVTQDVLSAGNVATDFDASPRHFIDIRAASNLGEVLNREVQIRVRRVDDLPSEEPVVTTDPSIVGTPIVGNVLVADPGAAAGFPPPQASYQWRSDTVAISGADGATYVLTAAEEDTDITVTVTWTNIAGTDSATSTSIGPVLAELPPVGNPPTEIVFSGLTFPKNASPGFVIGTATTTDIDNHAQTDYGYYFSDTLSQISSDGLFQLVNRELQLLGTPASIGTTTDYGLSIFAIDPQELTFAKTFTITGQAFDAGQGASAPVNTAPPTISGIAKVDHVLTVDPGTWTGNGTPGFQYQLNADAVAILGATQKKYVVQEADLTKVITVTVTAINNVDSVAETSDATAAITATTFGTKRYIAPTTQGNGDGTTLASAAPLSSLPAFITTVGADGFIGIRGDLGTYAAELIQISSGGTSGHSVTIRGIDGSGLPLLAEIVGTRANPWSVGAASGSEVIRLLAGANYLSFEFLEFTNVGNGAFRFGDVTTGVNIESCEASNVLRFIENLISGAATTASMLSFTCSNCTVRGFSRAFARIQYASTFVLADLYGDSEEQDGENSPVGINLDGTASGTIDRATMRRMRNTRAVDAYWQGDGFSQETGNTCTYTDCEADTCDDGGFDLKGTCTLVRCRAANCKRNFRAWDIATFTECVGLDPYLRGGTGVQGQLWIDDPSSLITATDCAFADNSVATAVYELEGVGSNLTTVNTSVQKHASATLTYNPGGGTVSLDTETPPSTTVAPVLSGTQTVGQTLSVTLGSWTGTGHSFTQRWKRNGLFLNEATLSTYTLQVDDSGQLITCTVYCEDSNGYVGEATTAPTGAIAGVAPSNVIAPSISGLPATGAILTCDPGEWDGAPAPTLAPQWYRGAGPISGATALTYTAQVADEGLAIKCRITATNSIDSEFEDSNALTINAPTTDQVVYVGHVAFGSGDGSSPSNAVGSPDLSIIGPMIGGLGSGSVIRVLSRSPQTGLVAEYVLTAPVNITTHGGAIGSAKIVIEGWDPLTNTNGKPLIRSNRTAWTLPTNAEQSTDIRAWAIGERIFEISDGVDNLVFRSLNFERCGDGCFFFAGDSDAIEIDDHTFYNVKRFIETASLVAELSNSIISNISGIGFSENAFRIRGTSHTITLADIDCNSGRQDGDNFAMGVTIDETAHDIEMFRVIMRNAHDGVLNGASGYWNGDGFVSNLGTYNIYREDCEAYGSTDAGFDDKFTVTAEWKALHPYEFVRCTAGDNKKNFKSWQTYDLLDCISEDPFRRGGTSSLNHYELASSSIGHTITVVGGEINGGGTVGVTLHEGAYLYLQGVDFTTEPSLVLSGPGQAEIDGDCTGDIPATHADSTIPTHVGSATGTNVNPTYTVAWPATKADDIAILIQTGDLPTSMEFPADFTPFGPILIQGGFGQRAAWKRLTGRMYGSVKGTFVGGSGAVRGSQLSVFDGCAPTGDPFEGYATAQDNGATMTSPTTVVSGDDRAVIRIFGSSFRQLTNNTPAGYTNRIYHTTSFANDMTIFLDSKGDVDTSTEAATARGAGGTTDWTSFSFALKPQATAAPSAPTNISPPTVTGTLGVGLVLTGTSGAWSGSPAPTFAPQWQRGTSDISGATAWTYTQQSADVASTLRLKVTATNSQAPGGVQAFSVNTGIVPAPAAAPTNTAAPAITGTAQVSATLTRTTGSWTGSPTSYATRWFRGANVIAGQTAATYVVTSADLGFQIRAEVTATNASGSSSPVLSSPTAIVTNPPNPPGSGNLYYTTIGCSRLFYSQFTTHPAGVRVAGPPEKTWITFEAGPPNRKAMVRVLDHTAQTWSSAVLVGTGLGHDDHGCPAICGPDANGYMYVFYGAHGTSVKWARTTDPGDPSAWTALTPFCTATSYPKPIIFGNKLYVFTRDQGSGGGQVPAGYSRGTISAGGNVTWDFTQRTIISVANDRRMYHAFTEVIGTEIYFVGLHRRNSETKWSYDNFVWVFDTATDTIRNATNTFSQSAATPISNANAIAYLKVVTGDPAGALLQRNQPLGLIHDGSNNLHLFYSDADGLEASVVLNNGAGSWVSGTAPPSGNPWRIADGRLRTISTGDWNLWTRSAAGVWTSAAAPIFTSERSTFASGRPVSFYEKSTIWNGNASSRMIWTECAQPFNVSTLTEENNVRGYFYNDAGIVRAP